jgi:hypothetical protein
MGTLEREFYRSARGPSPADEDIWRLAFDQATRGLIVRHEWQTARHSGTNEFGIDEFLAQDGAAPEALIGFLFEKLP